MAGKSKRKNSLAALKTAHREKRVRDLSPKWDSQETWTIDQFLKFFRDSMDYYRLEKSNKDLKPEVINWMSTNGYTKEQIKAFKDTKDHRCSSTTGSIAANLNRGMPPVRSDFNNGKNTALWLGNQIAEILETGKNDYEPEVVDDKPLLWTALWRLSVSLGSASGLSHSHPRGLTRRDSRRQQRIL